MRTSRMSARDAGATILLAIAATLFGLWQAGVDVPGFGSVRMTSAAIFVLGMFACGSGSGRDIYAETGVDRAIVAVLSVLGVATLGFGIAAMASGSATVMTIYFAGFAALWLLATIRHAVTPPAVPTESVAPERERVLVGR